jgi:hypothetical protein
MLEFDGEKINGYAEHLDRLLGEDVGKPSAHTVNGHNRINPPPAEEPEDDLTPEEVARLVELNEQGKAEQVAWQWPADPALAEKLRQTLLSAVLSDERFARVAEVVGGDILWEDEAHRILCKTALELRKDYGSLPDPVTLIAAVNERKIPEAAKFRALVEARAHESRWRHCRDLGNYWYDMLVRHAKHYLAKQVWAKVVQNKHRKEDGTDYDELRAGLAKAEEDLRRIVEHEDGRPDLRGDREWLEDDGFLNGQEPIQWVVPGFLAARCVTLFTASPKHGKSTVNFSLTAALATGQRWGGPKGPEVSLPRAVVWFDFENEVGLGWSGIRHELRGRKPLCPIIRNQTAPRNGYVSGQWLTEFLNANGLEPDPEAPPTVIVIDTARRAFQARFPKDPGWQNQGVGLLISELSEVAKTHNATILLVHHHNKAGKTAGDLDWEGSVDYIVDLSKVSDTIRMLTFRGRYGIENPPMPVYLTRTEGRVVYLGDDPIDQQAAHAGQVAPPATDVRKRLNLSRLPGPGQDPETATEIGKRAGVTRQAASKWLADYVQLGLVESEGKGFRLTADGAALLAATPDATATDPATSGCGQVAVHPSEST